MANFEKTCFTYFTFYQYGVLKGVNSLNEVHTTYISTAWYPILLCTCIYLHNEISFKLTKSLLSIMSELHIDCKNCLWISLIACDTWIWPLQEFDEEWAKKIQLEKFRWHNSQWLEMVETRQVTDMGDPYMYPEEGYDPYLQDADILDRPDLFYDGKALLICSFI